MIYFHYNLMTPDLRRAILAAITMETALVCGYHTMPEESAAATLLKKLGYRTRVYVCITPRICVESAHGQHPHTLWLDLREFTKGLMDCPRMQHTPIEFYWEVGGSMMDHGKPNRYVCCSSCGKQYKPRGFMSRLMSKVSGIPVGEPLIIRQARAEGVPQRMP